MLQIRDEGKNIIATIASGEVTYTSHPPLANLIKRKIDLYGKVRWLWFSHQFKYWSFRYFIVNGLFFLKHLSHFEKIAVVGEEPLVKLMAKALKLLKPGKVKHFKIIEVELYDQWILR